MYVLIRVQLIATQWRVARQAPLSMGFPRQGYCSGLPFPASGDLPDPGIEPKFLASPVLADGFFFFFKPLCHLRSPSVIYIFNFEREPVKSFLGVEK